MIFGCRVMQATLVGAGIYFIMLFGILLSFFPHSHSGKTPENFQKTLIRLVKNFAGPGTISEGNHHLERLYGFLAAPPVFRGRLDAQKPAHKNGGHRIGPQAMGQFDLAHPDNPPAESSLRSRRH
jgi:hypothetical protein